MMPFELEVAIFDWLSDRAAYTSDKDTKRERKTVYGAIVGRKADCMGYSYAFKYALSLVGIDSAIVYGDLRGDGHAWNIVMLDGQWYNVEMVGGRNETNIRFISEGFIPRHWNVNRTDAFMAQNGYTVEDSAYNPRISCTASCLAILVIFIKIL